LSGALLRLDFTANGARIRSPHCVLKCGYLKVTAADNGFAISRVCAGELDGFVRICCVVGRRSLAAERLPQMGLYVDSVFRGALLPFSFELGFVVLFLRRTSLQGDNLRSLGASDR
jgi:hypothetical protein